MNRRWLLLGLAVLGLGWGQAQSNYFGLGASLSGSSQYGLKYGLAPLVSVQIGGRAAPEFGGLELRATFDTLLLFSNVGLDALTSVRYPDASLRLYFGGGPDVLVFMRVDPLPGQEGPLVFFGAHGTVGLESLKRRRSTLCRTATGGRAHLSGARLWTPAADGDQLLTRQGTREACLWATPTRWALQGSSFAWAPSVSLVRRSRSCSSQPAWVMQRFAQNSTSTSNCAAFKPYCVGPRLGATAMLLGC